MSLETAFPALRLIYAEPHYFRPLFLFVVMMIEMVRYSKYPNYLIIRDPRVCNIKGYAINSSFPHLQVIIL